MSSPARHGRLVVVSAPSGTGKSTLCRELVARHDELEVSISYTTRAPRGDERDGMEYHFVDDTAFDSMVAEGALLEWAQVHERRYGTARDAVRALLDEGKDVLFDIDVQGGEQIKEAMPETLLVFVLPPSIDELIHRLTGRRTEGPDEVEGRLATAVRELEQGLRYDCHMVDDDLEEAVRELDSLRIRPLKDAVRIKLEPEIRRLLSDVRFRLNGTA